jgi:regulator of protease activity HflC (stomatin/prohibitin superfamily)
MELVTAGLAVTVAYLFASLRVLRQYERGVAFFLGRYWGTKGPGLIFLPALFSGQKRVSLRIVAMDIPPQDVITRDNVSVKVNAVLYMRVTDPAKAVIEIEDYLYATSQLAQTTLRSVLGEVELDELLSDREKINAVLKKIIDERTDAWGIEVSAVEVKDVDLPDQMKRAMARQAEAERERRAKVIAAQGELQASETLAEAAKTLAREPNSMQLRYLQTVTEIAAENNSTTIFPIPMELFRPWIQGATAPPGPSARTAGPPAALPASDTAALPPEIQKALAPSLVTEGGIPATKLADMMQQLRVEWAQRTTDTPSGEHE